LSFLSFFPFGLGWIFWLTRMRLCGGKEAHHFKSTRYAHQPVSAIAARDTTKQMQAQFHGITLITIPFWWDRTPDR
jgi:hypothetical protein